MTYQGDVGADSAAAVAQRSGDRAARSRRRRSSVVAADRRGRLGAAEGRGAGPADGSRRRRPQLHDLVQLYSGIAPLGSTTLREIAREGRPRTAAADGSGRGLAGRQCSDGTPPPENAAQTASLSRPAPATAIATLVGRVRRPHDHRGLGGRPDGAPVPGLSAASPRLRSCSMLSRAPASCRRHCQERRGVPWSRAMPNSRCPYAVSSARRIHPSRQRTRASHPVSAEWVADRCRRRGREGFPHCR